MQLKSALECYWNYSILSSAPSNWCFSESNLCFIIREFLKSSHFNVICYTAKPFCFPLVFCVASTLYYPPHLFLKESLLYKHKLTGPITFAWAVLTTLGHRFDSHKSQPYKTKRKLIFSVFQYLPKKSDSKDLHPH